MESLANRDDLSAFYKSEDREPPRRASRVVNGVNRRQSVKVQQVQEMVDNSYKPIALIDKYVDSLFPETELIDKRDVILNGVGFPILISYHIVFLLLFLVFFIIGYIKDTTTVYLAPYSAQATDNCKTISISTTQTFKVDSQGIWEGSSGYDESKAVYEIELIRANINDEMYYNMMTQFEAEIQRVSKLAQSRDLQFHAIALSSFNARWTPSKEERKQGGEGVINMYFIGRSEYVFNSDIEDYSFFDNNSSTICTPTDSSLEYDLTTGGYVMTIDTSVTGSKIFNEQQIVEPCPNVFKLYDSFVLSYTGMRKTEKIEINAASLTTALAVTYGIAPLSSLTKIFDITSNPDTWAGYRRRLSETRRALTSSSDLKVNAAINRNDIESFSEILGKAEVDSSNTYGYYYYGDDGGDDDFTYLPGYTGGYFVDHYYSSMDNIFCLSPLSTKPSNYNDACFLQVGQMLVLPMIVNRGYFNQTGTNIFRDEGTIELAFTRCQTSECPELFEIADEYNTDPDTANVRFLKSSVLLLAVPITEAVTDETILDSLISIASNSYDTILDAAMYIANSAYNQVIYKDAFPDDFDFLLDYKNSSKGDSAMSLREYMNYSINSFFDGFGESR